MIIRTFNFVIIVILTSIIIISGQNNEDTKISTIQKLHDKLLINYDRTIRPVEHQHNMTEVHFTILPRSIIKVSEDNSLFWLDGFLYIDWDDYRLTWNPENYDGIHEIHLPNHLVWEPDIIVSNWHSGWVKPKFGAPLVLHYTGKIISFPPAVLVTRCPIELKGTYPNDKLTCDIVFASYGPDGWKTDLIPADEEMYTSHFSNSNPRWELLTDEVKLERKLTHYNCCDIADITMTASFPMRRRPPPELQVARIPSILVMSLSLMMFLIPSNSNKKVILGGFIILVLCLLITYVTAATISPKSVYQAAMLLETALCVACAATIIEMIVINLQAFTNMSKPPAILISALSNPFVKYLAIWPPWETINPGDMMRLQEYDDIIRSPSAEEEWTLVTTCLDRLFFVIFLVILLVIHQI